MSNRTGRSRAFGERTSGQAGHGVRISKGDACAGSDYTEAPSVYKAGAIPIPEMVPDPPKATRKVRADSARNRERLLAAAAEVFRAADGSASLEAVARKAGVGIGTLYRHFPTREALFEAVYRREVGELARLAETLAAREPPLPALRLWLREEVRLVATKRGMLTALALAVDSGSELYAFSFTELTRAVGLLLHRCVKAGEIRGDIGPEDLLQTLVGLCLMAKEPDWEGNVVRLMDVFVDGMRAGAGRPDGGGDDG